MQATKQGGTESEAHTVRHSKCLSSSSELSHAASLANTAKTPWQAETSLSLAEKRRQRSPGSPQKLKQVTDLGSSSAPVHSVTTTSSLYTVGVLYNPRWCEHANVHTTEGS